MFFFVVFIKNDCFGLQVDYLFIENMVGGNKERVMLLMVEYVKVVNFIFKNIDFSDDNKVDGKVMI